MSHISSRHYSTFSSFALTGTDRQREDSESIRDNSQPRKLFERRYRPRSGTSTEINSDKSLEFNAILSQADGFSLDILPKLRDIKTQDNTSNLLFHVVNRFCKSYPKVSMMMRGTQYALLNSNILQESYPLADAAVFKQASLVWCLVFPMIQWSQHYLAL